MKHILCSNGSWINFGSSIEVGFMTLISAYIELFIRGETSGGECPDTDFVMDNIWNIDSSLQSIMCIYLFGTARFGAAVWALGYERSAAHNPTFIHHWFIFTNPIFIWRCFIWVSTQNQEFFAWIQLLFQQWKNHFHRDESHVIRIHCIHPASSSGKVIHFHQYSMYVAIILFSLNRDYFHQCNIY